MHLREAPTMTIESVMDQLDQVSTKRDLVQTNDMQIRLHDRPFKDRVLVIGKKELPASETTLEVVGGYFGLPAATLRSLDLDISEYVVNTLLERSRDEVALVHGDFGISEMRDSSIEPVEVRRLVEVAAQVVSPKALVDTWQNGHDEFRLDVHVNPRNKKGVGGDRKVGDITCGGLRMGQNRKRNLAPWLARYTYRLVCTNGMEIADEALRIDIRAASASGIVEMFKQQAQRAWALVEQDIASYYDLRNVKVDDPSQAMFRIGKEAGLPDRTITTLISYVPSVIEYPGADVTMFDLVNIVTNLANSPGVKDKPARALQSLGGSIVTDHASRCGVCRSRL